MRRHCRFVCVCVCVCHDEHSLLALSYNQSGSRTQKELWPYADTSLTISQHQVWSVAGSGRLWWSLGPLVIDYDFSLLKISMLSRSLGQGRRKAAWLGDRRRSGRTSKLNFSSSQHMVFTSTGSKEVQWLAKQCVVFVVQASSTSCRLQLQECTYFEFLTILK